VLFFTERSLFCDSPQEAIYVVPGVDRVTVIFSTVFKEETDRIFGKVFLQVSSPLPSLTNFPLKTCRMQLAYSSRIKRNLSTPEDSLPSKERLRSSIQIASRRSRFAMFPDFPRPRMSVTSHLVRFPRSSFPCDRIMTLFSAVLFPRHFSHPDTVYKTITQIQLFRDYLHYHIKCSKVSSGSILSETRRLTSDTTRPTCTQG
jgi:actin related protein 2/3 complex, subunit 2